jgi:predicted nucleic acid-binding protein
VYVLDTDTIGNALHRSDEYPHLVRKIREANQRDLWISVVTAEELIAWGFNRVRDRRNQIYPRIINAYKILFDRLNDLKPLQILPFDEAAYREFAAIPAVVQNVIGTNDRRIAATALSRGFRVVTHNTQHFRLVPRLLVEDWTAAPLE